MPTPNLGLKTIGQSDYVSPDPINDNMQALDALGQCYVVASGKSGMWTYRRWSDGTYECWGRMAQQNSKPDISSGVANTGYKSFEISLPVTFAGYPNIFISARQDGNPKVHVCYVENSQDTATWYLGGMDMDKGADVECVLHVIGEV